MLLTDPKRKKRETNICINCPFIERAMHVSEIFELFPTSPAGFGHYSMGLAGNLAQGRLHFGLFKHPWYFCRIMLQMYSWRYFSK